MKAFCLCPGFLPMNHNGPTTGKFVQQTSLLSTFFQICPYEADINIIKNSYSVNYVKYYSLNI